MNEESHPDEAVAAPVIDTPESLAPVLQETPGPKPAFWQTRCGLILAQPCRTPVTRSLSEYGEWIEQELDTIGALLDEGQAVLQYGAEYGAQTLWLSKLVGQGGRVHVVEPRRLDHIALCSTLALNGVRNVYPLHAALGEKQGATVYLDAADDQPAETCTQMTLDALRLGKLHLVKVNRAGGLLPLLAGAEATLRHDHPIIYFRLSHSDQAMEEIKALKGLGYRCWSHLPYLHSALNFAGSTSNIFPGWVSQNVIATHREADEVFSHLLEL
ncbi:hypothetical protein [Dyella sp. C9]|uniref:hypothetical protein n=1 Tax=Dyella sp. C9 TaxID=2202154 RepID=UPI000DEF430E|nr:hypothetical protein [Dyella sp. C9]